MTVAHLNIFNIEIPNYEHGWCTTVESRVSRGAGGTGDTVPANINYFINGHVPLTYNAPTHICCSHIENVKNVEKVWMKRKKHRRKINEIKRTHQTQ